MNVYSGELVEGVDVAVKGSRIAYVGSDASHTIGSDTKLIDSGGMYIAPGFIDAHTHIDLYCSPSERARACLAHGTTSLFAEPNDIANTLGFEGVKLFAKMVRNLPIKVYILIPLACPQDPLFDETRWLSLKDGEVSIKWDNVAV